MFKLQESLSNRMVNAAANATDMNDWLSRSKSMFSTRKSTEDLLHGIPFVKKLPSKELEL